jgi:hypothetical protein
LIKKILAIWITYQTCPALLLPWREVFRMQWADFAADGMT